MSTHVGVESPFMTRLCRTHTRWSGCCRARTAGSLTRGAWLRPAGATRCRAWASTSCSGRGSSAPSRSSPPRWQGVGGGAASLRKRMFVQGNHGYSSCHSNHVQHCSLIPPTNFVFACPGTHQAAAHFGGRLPGQPLPQRHARGGRAADAARAGARRAAARALPGPPGAAGSILRGGEGQEENDWLAWTGHLHYATLRYRL
jgi:hypothetical protein